MQGNPLGRMEASDGLGLLFFDTFSHDVNEDVNLDLVQFPRPVRLSEVRVIPLGTKVTADVPGGCRLGATNPSTFCLELFVNNLDVQNAATFEKIGTLDYNDKKDIKIEVGKKVSTDGLILKGVYSTITVAIYGELASVQKAEKSSSPTSVPAFSQPKAPEKSSSRDSGGASPMAPTSLPRTSGNIKVLDWLDEISGSSKDKKKDGTTVKEEKNQSFASDLLDSYYGKGKNLLAPPTEEPGDQDHPREIPLDHGGPAVHDPRAQPPDPRGSRDSRHTRDSRDSRDRHSGSDRGRSRDPDVGGAGHRGSERERRDVRDPPRDHKDRSRPDTKPMSKTRTPPPPVRRRSPVQPPRTVPVRAKQSRSRSRSPLSLPEDDTVPPAHDEQPLRRDRSLAETSGTSQHGGGATGGDEREKFYGSNLSDGEIQEEVAEGYEVVSDDDDELASFVPPTLDDMDDDLDVDGLNLPIYSFNPYQVELAPLATMPDPAQTAYETEEQKFLRLKDMDAPQSAQDLLALYEKVKDMTHAGEWVAELENVPGLLVPGLAYLQRSNQHTELLDLLVKWAVEGLSMNGARAQPDTAFKIRHLKMGIRLTGSLASTVSYILFKLLTQDVQHHLIDLYEAPYMASSVKVMVVRALDNTTRFRSGLEWIVGQHRIQLQSGGSEAGLASKRTGYQRLICVMQQKQVAKCAVALKALIRKIHIFEILRRLREMCLQLTEKEVATAVKDADKTDVETKEELETPDATRNTEAEEQLIDNIVDSLNEILKVVTYAFELLGQSTTRLPAKVKFEVTKTQIDPMPNLFHMMTETSFLESLLVLMTSSACGAQVFNAVREVLSALLSSYSGLLYLSSQTTTVNAIIKALTCNSEFEFNKADDPDDLHPLQQFGLQIIYHMQAMQHVDQLREYHRKDASVKNVDDAEALAVLHRLYTMVFPAEGREAVVRVLGLGDNIEVFFPFIELAGNEELYARMRKSVCLGYTAMLLLMVLRYSEDMVMLEKYSPRIIALSSQEIGNGKIADKVAELQDWLHPLKNIPAFTHEHLPELLKYVKQYGEEIRDLPKGLVTTLRVVKHLALPPNKEPIPESTVELKYKYVLIELYSADCLTTLTNIMQKLSDLMLRGWQQGTPRTGNHGMRILAIVRPIVALTRAITAELIKVRGSEVKDLSCLKAVFSVHTVICSVSPSGLLKPEPQAVQDDVIGLLLNYTQPKVDPSAGEDAFAQSLWTMMMKELFEFVVSAPYTFLSGLMMVSELLPLPLPLLSRQEPTLEDVEAALTLRRQWAAHLQPISELIQNMTRALAGSSCLPLQQVLRRVCWQLADLDAPIALSVVRCLLDLLLESMDLTIERLKGGSNEPLPTPSSAPDPDSPPKDEARASGQTSRLLSLLSFLMNQPPVKAAFIYLSMAGGGSCDERYLEVLPRLARLFNVFSDKEKHRLALDSIVAIFQSLCDLEVTVLNNIPEDVENPVEFEIANTLPPRQQLQLIVDALLEHVGNQRDSYSSLLHSLRTLALLMDHDYGFYHVQASLAKFDKSFYNLFRVINNTFSKDSSDCIATLSSAMDCIQFMRPPPSPAADVQLDRRMFLTVAQLREILCWTEEQHPLDELKEMLLVSSEDDEALRSVHESASELVCILKDGAEEPTPPPLEEPILPPPASIAAQFKMRATVLLAGDFDEERLSSAYWLSTPMEESEQEPDSVTCDLEQMAAKYCPDLDIKRELRKTTTNVAETVFAKSRRRISHRKHHEMINTSHASGRSAYVAPMRGRGYGPKPGGGGGGGSRQDMFRSRTPNTSRPPSMHVDDFMKIEADAGQNPGLLDSSKGRNTSRDPSRGGRAFGDRGSRMNRSGAVGNSRQFSSPTAGGYGAKGRGRGGRMRASGGGSPTKSVWRNAGRQGNRATYTRDEARSAAPMRYGSGNDMGYGSVDNRSSSSFYFGQKFY